MNNLALVKHSGRGDFSGFSWLLLKFLVTELFDEKSQPGDSLSLSLAQASSKCFNANKMLFAQSHQGLARGSVSYILFGFFTAKKMFSFWLPECWMSGYS